MAATKAITISKRTCKIGPSINCRTEKNGDDDNPACDIPLVGLLLDKDDANKLVGPLFWESLFDNQGRGKAPKIVHPNIGTRVLEGKFEGEVAITLSPSTVIELEGIKLTSFHLEPLEGGLVSLSLKVQASNSIEKFVHKLIARQNSEVEVRIVIGDKVERAKSKQDELPLQGAAPKANGKSDDEGEEDEHRRANRAQADALSRSSAAH
jgi:hypothetical protein